MSTDLLEREDTEIILDVNLDDEIACNHCGKRADWRLSMKCCGDHTFKCDACYKEWRESYELYIRALRVATVSCGYCGHRFNRPNRLVDLLWEHKL